MSKFDYIRGSIHYCEMPKIQGIQHHSIQKGYRPVVIVSSLAGSMSNDNVMVCPLTTKIKDLSCNVNISYSTEKYSQSQVLCNQIITVPKQTLKPTNCYVTPEELQEIDKALLISLGITPAVASSIQKSQEALINAKADKEQLDKLIPEAKSLIRQLTEIISRAQGSRVKITKKGRIKRTPEEIEHFIREWNDPHNNRHEVAEAFGFNTYSAAYQFWRKHK
jgi:mRNA interferase MazF